MPSQLHVALGLVESRARASQDQHLVRSLRLARQEARRQARSARRAGRSAARTGVR